MSQQNGAFMCRPPLSLIKSSVTPSRHGAGHGATPVRGHAAFPYPEMRPGRARRRGHSPGQAVTSDCPFVMAAELGGDVRGSRPGGHGVPRCRRDAGIEGSSAPRVPRMLRSWTLGAAGPLWTLSPPFPKMGHPSRALFPAGFLFPESRHRQKVMPLQLPHVLHQLPGPKLAVKSSHSITPCCRSGPGVHVSSP